MVEVEQPGGGIEQAGDVAVFHQYALRQTGGARGVDDVGQVLRRQAQVAGLRVQVQAAVEGGVFAVQFVEGQDRYAVCRQGVEAGRLCQQRYRGAVVQQVAEAFGRVGRVQRHVGRAGLEHGQHRAEHVDAAQGKDRHPIVGAHPLGEQGAGNAVGAAVEGLVSQRLFAENQGGALRMLRRLGFEALVNQLLHGENRLRRQQRRRGLALCRAEQWQAEHRLCDIGDHRFEQDLEVLGEALHGRAVEQVAGVLDHPGQRAVRVAQCQHQVELRGFMGLGHGHQAQPRQAQLDGRRGIVQRQGDLAQRVVAQRARRLQGLDHLLERNVLVLVGRQGGLADLFQQLFHARVLAQVHAQGQGVDEEADQVFGFGTTTVGRRYADHHIAFVAQARHQH
ncbi:hypothetical protein UCMB321_2184 [Pseudomonas batumici]|uniref:Uncharacterized protein n=1 Tax=Pseudomonas batumici TaxID=226910 RepID=A0A0C2IAU6_9PSED|nr:hypothetical protein UCMB321_2184 [Pseudomonas batumici]